MYISPACHSFVIHGITYNYHTYYTEIIGVETENPT